MYEERFGLTGRPFALTPDPDFWFESGTHRRAMAYLSYGLNQAEGFVVITGEVGSGKTTLLRRLMAAVDADRMRVVSLVSTQLGADDTLRAVAGELGVAGGDKAAVIAGTTRALQDEARDGRRVLLIVDEAQNLSLDAVEELRMLSNIQLGPDPLVQIVLVGQPELRERLSADPAMEQVRQRVIATHHLGPMEADEVGPYLRHRLTTVGWTGRPEFTDDAVARMDRWAGGLPRLLNMLAQRVLMAAAIADTDTIEQELVERVVADLGRDDAAALTVTAHSADAPDTARLQALEARVEAQDRVLRQVLTLLIDWLQPEPASAERLRGVA